MSFTRTKVPAQIIKNHQEFKEYTLKTAQAILDDHVKNGGECYGHRYVSHVMDTTDLENDQFIDQDECYMSVTYDSSSRTLQTGVYPKTVCKYSGSRWSPIVNGEYDISESRAAYWKSIIVKLSSSQIIRQNTKKPMFLN